ncbi:AMP-dependent synthetase/ligase [Penicillium concentricum]|uniref:AMP-dependent synthetase/ligase n=1 Tax=Penicillium concentricum TaxID=293559 RepID=A0A9W9SCN2_9EURO|nr:AMP-dependent synthetase/ligase [Penicillium concentricum]KAJ5374719.1 AMP-dependent synthetase/ligase [Penicillium concentricum]
MEKGVQPPPPLVHARVHDLIVAQCQTRPSEPAIAAWNGHLTYHELDQCSSRLATQLAKLNVIQSGKIVPILMEKSAGGAFLMDISFTDDPAYFDIDPSSQSCEITKTPILRVGGSRLLADDEVGKGTHLQSVYARPSDACHGLFISGSSGDSRVVVIDHVAVCTAWAQLTATQLALSSSSRVFQFGSHAFGASVAEYLGAMIHGACLCIASELGTGNDKVKAIRELNANFITLTPSASRLLDPNQVPSLQVVILAGEVLGPLDLEKWQGQVQLKCMYGLAETAGFALLADLTKPNSNYSGYWSADSSMEFLDRKRQHCRRSGTTWRGSLGRVYLNDPARTVQNYIPAPSWLMQIRPTAPHDYRCLKTGGLVCHSSNGTIEYIRRKDVAEVKIRGQRVDLTHIERHLARQYPTATRVAVNIIIPSDDIGHSGIMLVGFIHIESPQYGMQKKNEEIFASPTMESREKATTVLSKLKEALLTFMVPDVVVILKRIPATTSGKLHCDRLRRLASGLSRRALLAYGDIQPSETNNDWKDF